MPYMSAQRHIMHLKPLSVSYRWKVLDTEVVPRHSQSLFFLLRDLSSYQNDSMSVGRASPGRIPVTASSCPEGSSHC